MIMKKGKFIILFIGLLVFLSVVFTIQYKNGIMAVDPNSKNIIDVLIPKGSTAKTVMKVLKSKDLIKSEFYYKVYLKLNSVGNIKAGTYKLSKNMDLKDIFKTLEKGSTYSPDEVKITFVEGLTINKYASIIEKYTNNKKEDVFNLINDEIYQNELISKYWFITDDIKNPRIYYPLEGYLFPDTYFFKNKNVTVKEIFDKMLKQTEAKLKPYKSKILKEKMNVHELLTLASMVELEGSTKENKKLVASVFYNRIRLKMRFDSDVTTLYGQRVDLKDHSKFNRNHKSDYNTYTITGYPVGPICSPSMIAIETVINPTKSDYIFFVSDKNRKMYFTKTEKQHLQIIKELKEKGLWL